MDPQVEDSKWKDDFYIIKFLELLLKYKHELIEKDEDFTESERLPEYFHEFQEVLTLYDINLEMEKIRELYEKEALKLKKVGKAENESKLPWFSKAESLFSHTVNWGNLMEEHAKPSSFENFLSEEINDTSPSLPCSDAKLLSLPSPTQIPSTENEKIILPAAFICLFPPIAKSSLSSTVKTSDKARFQEPIARKNLPLKSKAFVSAETRKITIPSTFMCLFPPVSKINLSPSLKD